jgi:hypothetical protein
MAGIVPIIVLCISPTLGRCKYLLVVYVRVPFGYAAPLERPVSGKLKYLHSFLSADRLGSSSVFADKRICRHPHL